MGTSILELSEETKITMSQTGYCSAWLAIAKQHSEK